MSLQRNVAQQAEDTKTSILRAVAIGESKPQWLVDVLRQKHLEIAQGILVSYAEVLEQEGHRVQGRWLAGKGDFWEFEALVSYQGRDLLELEKFDNVTAMIPISRSLPGTGPSFAFLALQVLHERCGA